MDRSSTIDQIWKFFFNSKLRIKIGKIRESIFKFQDSILL